MIVNNLINLTFIYIRNTGTSISDEISIFVSNGFWGLPFNQRSKVYVNLSEITTYSRTGVLTVLNTCLFINRAVRNLAEIPKSFEILQNAL